MKLSHLIVFSGCLLIFFACRNKPATKSVTAQDNRSLISFSGSDSKNQQSTDYDDPASDRFLVDPELAIMQASLHVVGNSFIETKELIENNTNFILKGINQTKGCTAKLTDYFHPQQTYRQKVLSVPFSSSQKMQVTISFAETTNIRGRIQQLNKCIETIASLKLANPSPKKTDVNLNLTKPLPTIINANKYRKQILASKFSGLSEVAAIADNPTQFNAKDTECTTNGKVYITKRSISKLELDVDFKCQQFGE